MENTASDTVTPIRTSTNTPLPAIKTGFLEDIALTPNGKTLYVSRSYPSSLQNDVTPIRTATDTALRPIPVFEPDIIAVAPNGEVAYASARNSVHEYGRERLLMLLT